MEAIRTTIDISELERALAGETVSDLESLAKDLEAQAMQLQIRDSLDQMRTGTMQDVRDLRIGDLEGSAEDGREGTRMTDRTVVEELKESQVGHPLSNGGALARALLIRAEYLRKRVEKMRRMVNEGGDREDSPEGGGGQGGAGETVDRTRDETTGEINDVLRPSPQGSTIKETSGTLAA